MLKSKFGSLICATSLGLLGAVAVNSAPAAAQNLVQNGSFETGNFTDWSVGDSSGYEEVVPSGYDLGIVTYSSEDGNYYAALGSSPLYLLSQNISTNIGDTYQLTYYLASDGYTPNEFQTIVGGNTLSDLTNIASQSYTEYTFNFTATSTTTQIAFGEYDSSSFLALDNVSVVDTGAASSVPEPLTTGGTLVAVGMGWWMRRKRGSFSKGN
jgi:hypothetical protein